MHEAKLCYLPENGAWVADFVESLSAFPTAPHDDDVDAFVMTLDYASRGGSGLLQFMQKEAEKIR